MSLLIPVGLLTSLLTNLSELDTFSAESDIMWRGFVASAIAAVSLQLVNPFGTAKMVLFQVRKTISININDLLSVA